MQDTPTPSPVTPPPDIVYKGEPRDRGDPAVGILRLGGPSGQGTEGEPRTAAAKEGQCGSSGRFCHAGEGGSNGEEVGVGREQG